MKQIREFFILFCLALKVRGRNLIEFLHVISHYYRNFSFCKIDLSLLSSYLFTSPFRLSKQFLLLKGEEDVYVYGETPLTTLEMISTRCQISNHDVVFEVGCGRARTCFWLNQWIGCQVVGIDHVSVFIQKANAIKHRFKLSNVSFRLEDIFQADYTRATVLYLYATCFTSDQIERLIQCFAHLPNGTKVISISYALEEYQISPMFRTLDQFSASFTWGEAEVYLQVKEK